MGQRGTRMRARTLSREPPQSSGGRPRKDVYRLFSGSGRYRGSLPAPFFHMRIDFIGSFDKGKRKFTANPANDCRGGKIAQNNDPESMLPA